MHVRSVFERLKCYRSLLKRSEKSLFDMKYNLRELFSVVDSISRRNILDIEYLGRKSSKQCS